MKPYAKLLVASFLTILACLGFARFAFGMILPNLQADLSISTTIAGFIGTANFIGYLIGIIFASWVYKTFATDRLIATSLFLQGLSMIAMTFSHNYIILSVFYFCTGFFGAIANISIMVYLAHTIPEHIRGKALGLAVSGNGIAIILSGFIVPYLETIYAAYSWRVSWSLFALSIILIAFIVKNSLENRSNQHKTQTSNPKALLQSSSFWKISSLYFIFGVTYVVYVTFFVSASIDKWQVSSELSGLFWALFGFICIFGGPLFGAMADKIGAYKTLMLVFSLQTIANIILVFNVPQTFLWFSVLSFGISVWSIPSLITLLCSQHFGLEKTAQAFSLVTLIFAIGQVIAPISAGFLYDLFKTFDYVFLLSSLSTALGVVLAYLYIPKKTILIKVN